MVGVENDEDRQKSQKFEGCFSVVARGKTMEQSQAIFQCR